MVDKKEMLEGYVPALLRKIAAPAAVGLVFNTLFNVTDTLFASRYSVDALAGLTLAGSVFFLILSLSVGISSGLTVLMSHSRGDENHSHLPVLFKGGLILGALLWFLVLVVFVPVQGRVIKFILVDEQKGIIHALSYLNIITPASVFFILNGILNSVLVSAGNTKIYRNYLITGFFLNIVLDYLFMFGPGFFPRLGVGGTALATVLIQIAGSIYLFFHVKKSGFFVHGSGAFKEAFQIFPKVAGYGLPSFLNLVSIAGIQLIVQYFLLQTGSAEIVAGYGAGGRIEQLVLLPFLGLSTAVLLVSGNCYGAGRLQRIKTVIATALQDSFILTIILFLPVLIFRSNLALFFTGSETAAGTAAMYIIFSALLFYFNYISIIAASLFQSLKRPHVSAVIYVFANIVFPLVGILIFKGIGKDSSIYIFGGYAAGKAVAGILAAVSIKVAFNAFLK